jgi:hypothetical protein
VYRRLTQKPSSKSKLPKKNPSLKSNNSFCEEKNKLIIIIIGFKIIHDAQHAILSDRFTVLEVERRRELFQPIPEDASDAIIGGQVPDL